LGSDARAVQMGICGSSAPSAAIIADRYGRRLTICGSLFVVVGGDVVDRARDLVFRALAHGAHALMGVSEAFYIPAALALIADFHTGATRSRAVGAASDGHLLRRDHGRISADTSRIAPALGWRWGFDACVGWWAWRTRCPCCGCCGMRNRECRQASEEKSRDAHALVCALRKSLRNGWFVHFTRALLHAARAGGLGGARLDAGTILKSRV
jgi:hypothetical protein